MINPVTPSVVNNNSEKTVEIDEAPVPLAETVEFEESSVPLAETPDMSDTATDDEKNLVDFADMEVPLADNPKTGTVFPILAAIAAMGSVLTGVALNKKKN